MTKGSAPVRTRAIALILLLSIQSATGTSLPLGNWLLVQPDGTSFTVRRWADEFGHYQAALEDHGYVVEDSSTGYHHYARYHYDESRHRLITTPTSLRVGRDGASGDRRRVESANQSAFRGNTLEKLA